MSFFGNLFYITRAFPFGKALDAERSEGSDSAENVTICSHVVVPIEQRVCECFVVKIGSTEKVELEISMLRRKGYRREPGYLAVSKRCITFAFRKMSHMTFLKYNQPDQTRYNELSIAIKPAGSARNGY